MSVLTSAAFWVATGERAVKTTAQVAGVLFAADQIGGILDLDWSQTGSVLALSALASIATSLASIPITGSPSLGGETIASTPKRGRHRAGS